MASKMLLQVVTRGLPKRSFSASSMAVPLTEAPPYFSETPISSRLPTTGPVQVTKLPNGITVASRETSNPYSRIGVFIKSGSRSETYNMKGATRVLANCAFLSTVDKSTYVFNKELDHLGININCSNTREFIVYNALLPKGTEELVLDRFGSVISSPALQEWEVLDERPRLSVERTNATPETIVMEELHKYSFRSGLSNTLYCPSFNEGNIDANTLRDFIESWYTCQNTTIVGLGVNHDTLTRLVNKAFSSLPDLLPRTLPKADYIGGSEIRIDSDTNSTCAAIACKGASLTDKVNVRVASGVLQHILGDRQYIKWGTGSVASRLSKAVASKVDNPFQINSFSINYSDNGLFGMCATANGNDMKQVLKTALLEFTNVAKGNFSEQDLTRAKNQLKSALYSNGDSMSCETHDIAQQVAFTGSYQDIDESVIDSITAEDVTKFAKTVFATRPNIVVYGNLSDVPRMDELLPGVSVK